MKPTLKNTLMALTMLSTGFFILSFESAQAGFQQPKAKAVAANISFKQYPKLGEVKADVNVALDLHQTAVSLLADKKQLEEYKASIEKYNEIERRLNQNTQCNISLLNENFSNGATVWKKASAYAEDTASTLLAEASDSFGDAESSSKLKALENKVNAGDASDDGTASASAANSPYANINENTTTEQANAMVAKGSAEAESATTDMDMDEASAFGKIRWDVGYAVLKDIYASPKKWGSVKKKFTPWVDQKHVYDVYLENHYKEMEKSYKLGGHLSFPARPALSSKDSYLPEDYYSGEVPAVTVSNTKYNSKTATVDEKWCGQTDGKKNKCVRVNKGSLYTKHQAYVKALKAYKLKDGYSVPNMEPPYLPQKPLPPWRESVYIMSVEKQIPEIASELPDPWYKVTESIDNFTSSGELSNLVEKHGSKVRYRPGDYNAATGEIKNDSHGIPKLPIPLMTNRIGSYLALVSAKEEQEPVKDRAIASIKEMNENILSTLSKAGYTVPNADSFDLAKESDYNMALKKMGELQNAKIASAKSKMQSLTASFSGKLLPSVQQVLAEETTTMNALQKDTEFLVNVTRDNASEINSLLLTAVADATANENYKDNLSGKMEELSSVPAVGCPVL
ncbi:MAG: hypothetical protein IJ752_03590 [Alphaproteobacteria bacterium]|nr:hypothetical protein [Alphaproteobacteria bacterium]